MDDFEKAMRSNRWLLAFSAVLFIGALSLVVAGYRGLAGWAVLLSCGVNLLSAVIGRRALAPRRGVGKPDGDG